MKSPAFQFYPADFLVGIMGLSDEEVGVYIKMLSFQWVKGGLPTDLKTIRIAVNLRKNPSENVMKKFTIFGDGLLKNKRLEKEREKQLKFRESRAENAKAGWGKRSTSNARAKSSICTEPCITDALQSSSSSSSSSSPSGFSKPSPDEVRQFGLTLAPPFTEAGNFVDFYESKGWKVGKSPMKDWKAAVRNWHRKANPEPGGMALRSLYD